MGRSRMIFSEVRASVIGCCFQAWVLATCAGHELSNWDEVANAGQVLSIAK